MKDKIYEFVTLMLYCILYGIAIGRIIFFGIKDALEFALFVWVSILVIVRVFSATITLLKKENENERS